MTDMSESGQDIEAAPEALPPTLPECCIKVLGRPGWFDPALLRAVRLRPANPFVRAIQRMARRPIAATTIGDTIYFRDAADFDPHSPPGLGLLAHELRHVEQYRERGGVVRFSAHYVLEFLRGGYRPDISFEAEAYEVESIVRDHLRQEFTYNASEALCLTTPAGHTPNPQYRLLEPSPTLPWRA
ncbi:MAG: DUF4157 domain-containing protein [Anaerolineae bacterium]